MVDVAYNFIQGVARDGEHILFVGTKKQAHDSIQEEALRCGEFFVNERWLGGMLTNWNTMFNRIQELEKLERMRDSGEIHRLTKKEGLLIEREIKRLQTRLSGVREMKRVPDLIFIVDVMREHTAVHEANVKGIPVVALVDTNCDPRGVDYVIPSNDDAIRAIKLLDERGTLVTCSCSHAMDEGRFKALVASAASDAEKRLALLDFRYQAPDHPILLGYGESLYLKCGFYRLLS